MMSVWFTKTGISIELMSSISSEVLRVKACGRHLTSFKVKSQYFASLKLQLKTWFKVNLTLGGGISLKLGEYFAIETEHAEYS